MRPTSSSTPTSSPWPRGCPEHDNYAVDFMETCRTIKDTMPGALISGGISNLSFSFRGNDTVREAMHAVFLYHAIKAGLDMGIVNAGQLAVYEEVEPALLAAAEDVILNRREDGTERLLEIAARTEGRKTRDREDLSWREQDVAGRLRQRAAHRRGRPHRGRHPGGHGAVRRPAADHRGAPDGGAGQGGRAVRGREDVPAPESSARRGS